MAGRAGRAELPGEVFVQSFDPSSPVLRAAAVGDFAGFAARELKDREEGFYPPYCRLAVVAFASEDLTLVAGWADLYARSLAAYAERCGGGRLVVSDAVPSALEKADGRYRWQIVLRAPSAGTIVRAWRWITGERPPPRAVRVVLDVDAYNLT